MNKEKIEKIAEDLLSVLVEDGYDGSEEDLQDTPKRVAKAWAEMLDGYTNHDELNVGFLTATDNLMVVHNEINFESICEHHLLPFYGVVHIAYIPQKGGRVLGVSKLPRLVKKYSHRLQLQERMTHQIADTLNQLMNAEGVMVVVEAFHSCEALRGVKSSGILSTSVLRGAFANKPEAKMEALMMMYKDSSYLPASEEDYS